ncbi:MAG: tRNA-dihydrouridine synthase, partial [Deltaproteobacteria bacterium]|nr:tRNA-dihydrouridine synthase [Deltaproteobacteria bacterium]
MASVSPAAYTAPVNTPASKAAPARSSSALPGPLTLGQLVVDPPVFQAPMSGLTNLPMRRLAEEHGCGMTITEWVPASGVATGVQSAMKRLLRAPGTSASKRRPLGVQLFGREPRAIERAAARILALGADVVDLNMGCPGKKVRSGSTGAALMREPELACELVLAARQGVGDKIPVTVKMRAGWDENQLNAPELAARVAEAGASMITVHGRTRQQRYTGTVDLSIIRAVKQSVAVPVVANGDIVDVPTMRRAFAETGADGVMVGRGARGNPWIFAQLKAAFEEEPAPALPSAEERLRMYLRHLKLYLEGVSERDAVIEMRKFAGWYLKEVPGGELLRR